MPRKTDVVLPTLADETQTHALYGIYPHFRVDLHVHSRFSTRPSQWLLQKLGCSESYSAPEEIYAVAMARGMDYVTLTDHNTIDGCLEIAHLPNTFISEEITSFFPENRCKIHVLAWNITERQHEDITRCRENIHDLVPYLREANISHACAHPLCAVNDRLILEHVEKLLLLFKVFELNGARNNVQNDVLRLILARLDARSIARLEDKYRFSAAMPDAWDKYLMAGSDDHSSCNIARSSTTVFVEPQKTGSGQTGSDRAGAPCPKRLLEAVMCGQTAVCGIPATPATFALNLYAIAYQFYKKHAGLPQYINSSTVLRFTENMLTGLPDTTPPTVRTRILSMAEFLLRFGRSRKRSQWSVQESILDAAERIIKSEPDLLLMAKDNQIMPTHMLPCTEQGMMHFIAEVTEGVQRSCTDTVLKDLVKGNFFNVIKLIGSISSLYALLTPYGIGYSLFTADKQFAEQCLRHFVPEEARERNETAVTSIGHFTDTYYEVNGVAKTLQSMLGMALEKGKELDILTCVPPGLMSGDGGLPQPVNFTPIGSFQVPDYPELQMHYPPVLKIIQHCHERGYSLLHAATPGPMGLAALLAAKMLKLPIHATYHTSFPQYMQQLTSDNALADMMWRYMIWFYKEMDAVFAPSESTARELVEHGLPRERVHVYCRGIDAEKYATAWDNRAGTKRPCASVNYLYVGRVSKEKNVELLVKAFALVARQLPGATLTPTLTPTLTIVGDGPMLPDLRLQAADLPVNFTGYLHGEDLLRAYEAADIFVFPSTTDTFGNVVLEAQAAGLAMIVSGQGGPRENIIPGSTGLVVERETAEAYARAMLSLARDPARVESMQRAARNYAESRSLGKAFAEQWAMYENVRRHNLSFSCQQYGACHEI